MKFQDKKIFWVGCSPPEWHSVGDQAQTLAVQKVLDEQFSDYKIKRFYRSEVDKFFAQKIRSDDLIFIQSSGDFGDLRNTWHPIRKKIAASYPDNKIVQLPVSVHYHNLSRFEADKIFFSGRDNLLILCRTPKGAKLLKDSFDCKVMFFPDFVFSLKPKLSNVKRTSCLGVFRADSESMIRRRLPNRTKKLLRSHLWRLANFVLDIEHKKRIRKLFPDCYLRDIQISDVDITDENRERIIFDTLRFYENFEHVKTDRFHACVFAYLTKTPFVSVKGQIKQKTDVDVNLDYNKYFVNFRSTIFSAFESKSHDINENVQDIMALIKSRRSVRKWLNQPVEYNKMKQILEAGVYAPSAANLQATRFKMMTDPEHIRFVCQNTSSWFKNSFPEKVILVFYDKSKLPPAKWTSRFIWQDSSCAMQNMMLTAKSLGLKSCWATVNPSQEKNIKHFLKIPRNLVLACMLFLGYSDMQVGLESRHQGRIIRRDVNKMVIK
jgi:exopolysaccharide biosynthesis predicted pyruvyltransferase EpsI/nitroreductase